MGIMLGGRCRKYYQTDLESLRIELALRSVDGSLEDSLGDWYRGMQVKIPYKPRDLQAEMHNKLKEMECA